MSPFSATQLTVASRGACTPGEGLVSTLWAIENTVVLPPITSAIRPWRSGSRRGLRQDAAAEPQILEHLLEPGRDPDRARVLLRQRDVAERAPRAAAAAASSDRPRSARSRRLFREMEADLVVEIAIGPGGKNSDPLDASSAIAATASTSPRTAMAQTGAARGRPHALRFGLRAVTPAPAPAQSPPTAAPSGCAQRSTAAGPRR